MRKHLMFATTCAVALLAFGTVSTTPAFAQAKQPTISKNLAKPLKAAQEAMEKKNWQEALARINEADAQGNKTPYDQFTINQMKGFVHVRMGNYSEAAKALEASLNSGLLPQDEVGQRIIALAQVNYQIKNYDKAIEFGNRAVKGGYADADLYTLIGQAYYIKGDYKGTLGFVDTYVNDMAKKGQTPKEQMLQLALSSCVKLKDDACATKTLEKLVVDYPKPEYWQNIVYSMMRSPDTTDVLLLNTYRLALEVDALKEAQDYTEMAQLAIEQGSPGEAVAILEKGFKNNVFPDQREKDRNQRLLDSAKKAAAADQAALAKLDSEAARGKAGAADIGVGKGFLSYGQFDKAEAAIARGISKGGLRNADEATLLLGIAQLKGGKKDQAIKTFKSLKGDPKYARLGNLWALHARA